MSEWGRVFLDILTTHGVSQQKLSKRIGYDHSTLSRYVNGSRVPTREVCAAISEALTLATLPRRQLFLAAGFLPDDLVPAREMLARLYIVDFAGAEVPA